MPATVVLGGQWGDEGKGKITDALAVGGGMVVRANGGSNAGHTIETEAGIFKMHLVPSGILNPDCTCVIGAGVVIDPLALAKELDELVERGIDTSNIIISDRAHVVLPFHSEIDRREENLRGERSIGTTLRGIGPAYADKVSRRGLRMVDLMNPQLLSERLSHQLKVHASVIDDESSVLRVELGTLRDSLSEIGERLGPHIGPAEQHVQDALDAGVHVILECAQGVMLDIDYGTYPFVTSSSPSTAGACQGAGVAPNQVERVIGVFKAYSTRVGAGPMPTELLDDTGALIRERGKEYGTTTGRPRRTGWFDAVAGRNAVRLNGVTEIALTLTDVFDVFSDISVCTGYQIGDRMVEYIPADLGFLVNLMPIYEAYPGWLEDITSARSASQLPEESKDYAKTIGDRVGAPVTMIGVGPGREQLVSL